MGFIMKRFQLSFILIITAALTIFIVQSCDISQPEQQKSDRQKERAVLKKAFHKVNKKYKIQRVSDLSADVKTLQKVKSIYNNSSKKILKTKSTSTTQKNAMNSTFLEGKLNGKIDYKKGKIVTIKTGETYLKVPVTINPESYSDKYIKIAFLYMEKGNPSDGALLVKKYNKEYINEAKEKGYNKIEFAMYFTGTVKKYRLDDGHVVGLSGHVFRNGKLMGRVVLSSSNETGHVIAGAPAVETGIGHWFKEKFNQAKEWWNDSCLGKHIGEVLVVAGGSTVCLAGILGEGPSGLTDTAITVGACTAAVGGGIMLYRDMSTCK